MKLICFVEFPENLTVRKKAKDNLTTVSLFEFETQEKARVLEEALEKEEAEERRKRMELKVEQEAERIKAQLKALSS